MRGLKKEKGKDARRIVTAGASVCVISTVETKDVALIVNNTDFANKLNSAISVRTACQKTALGSTENQLGNLDACAKIFKDAVKTAKEATSKTHKEIWNTYQKSLKICAQNAVSTSDAANSAENGISTSTESVASEDNQGEIVIKDGGGSIIDVVSIEE